MMYLCLSSDDVKQAMQHMAAGRRNLLVQDYHAAEASLSQACEMFSKHYGETALECAEPCFYYGKALLELARLEAGVINNGLEGGKASVLLAIGCPVQCVSLFPVYLSEGFI